VAVLNADGRINLRPVRIGRNFGNTVEVLEGAAATDRLVLNPPDSMAEGDKVAVAPAGKEAK
jgi:multidrug efflux pump subunit AcrA (membrane-fusion protein)